MITSLAAKMCQQRLRQMTDVEIEAFLRDYVVPELTTGQLLKLKVFIDALVDQHSGEWVGPFGSARDR